MMTAEGGTETLSAEPRLGSGTMFDRIAPRYDLLNRLISMGLDKGWRRRLVDALAPGDDPPRRVLDLATGTADVALAIGKRYEGCTVVGLDPSRNMLTVGAKKAAAAGLVGRLPLLVGDGQTLPFGDDAFDASCISFGIRNVPDRDAALREMRRVTRPGGAVAVLELGEPRRGLLAPFARFHVRHVVPRIGGWLSGDREYRYLAASVAAFPSPERFLAQLRAAGLTQERVERLGFDAAHLYVARA